MAKYKIWWQSTMREGDYPEYTKAIADHAKKFLPDEYEIEMHGVKNGSDHVNMIAGKYFNDREVLRYMLEAKERKFDAVVFGCTQDPILDEARELLDIPVFSMLQTSLQWAQMYGTRPAILHYSNDYMYKLLPRLLQKYRAEDIVVKTTPFDITFDTLMEALLNDPEPAIDMSLKAAKEAVNKGADIIIPSCGLLNLILARNGIKEVPGTGVTIMDLTAILLKVAMAGIQLHEEAGLVRSNAGFYKRMTDEQIEEIKEHYHL